MAMNPKDLLVWIKSLSRGQALPLDASEVHESFEDAQEYANTAIAYGGQTVKVKLDDGKYHEYILQPSENGYTLEEIRGGGSAGIHVGDESSMPEGTVLHIDPDGEGYEIPELDTTLSKAGYAADANVTGEKFDELSGEIADKTGGSKTYYAVCETPGETNPKMAYTVTEDFVLEKGARVGVWFKYNNIGSQNLNVDDTGTFQWISERNADGSIVSDTPTMYKAGGQVHWFTFDGEYWIVDDSIRAGEDTVGKVTLAEIRKEAAKNHYTKNEVDNILSGMTPGGGSADYYIHISFDDVGGCTGNLSSKVYSNVWDEPFFGWLRGLHDAYGAKFSLYVWDITKLANIPDTYKDEFIDSSEWLKFGLHCYSQSGTRQTYSAATYAEGKSDWNLAAAQIARFAGSHKSVDRIPRLNYFEGTKEALKGMRDANCGALGFLCSDAVRNSYYLSDAQNQYLLTHDHIVDFENGLLFYQTDFRGDWFESGFSSAYTYDVPTQTDVYSELAHRLSVPKYGNTFKSLVWFCHEWQIYSGTTLNENKKWVEDACRFAYDYGIAFDFPQNRIGVDPTSYQFLSVKNDDSGADGGDTELTLTSISASYSGGSVAVGTSVNDLTGIVVTANYSDGSEVTVADYTLSGTIAEGENTIVVSYDGLTTTFTVIGVTDSQGGDENDDGFYRFNKIILPSGMSSGENSRALYITYEALAVGDIVSFDDETLYEKYSYAIAEGTDGINSVWIGGGYRINAYTVTTESRYSMLLKKNDGSTFTTAEHAEIQQHFGVYSNIPYDDTYYLTTTIDKTEWETGSYQSADGKTCCETQVARLRNTEPIVLKVGSTLRVQEGFVFKPFKMTVRGNFETLQFIGTDDYTDSYSAEVTTILNLALKATDESDISALADTVSDLFTVS